MLLGFVLLTLLAWRLSQGPVDLNFLTGRLEAALNTNGAPTQIKIGGIALAWEGFNRGHDSPLDLRLHDIAIVDNTGRKRLEIPSALTTLAVPSLLIGRVGSGDGHAGADRVVLAGGDRAQTQYQEWQGGQAVRRLVYCASHP